MLLNPVQNRAECGTAEWGSTYRQPVLIYNPAAGKLRRDSERTLQRTIGALGGGTETILFPTQGPGQAGELARKAVQDGADLILVLGGDGTINEALQGLVDTQVPLAVLPGGTANVLAMELGLGSRLERAAQRLADCQPQRIAVGKLTGARCGTRYFLLMCGLGLDAEIITGVDPGLKAKTGKLAYWASGFGHLTRRVAPLEIRIDGQEQICGFALASRVRNYGGDLEIASRASLLDDRFHLVWFDGSSPLRYSGYMLAVSMRQVLHLPGVHQAQVSSLELLTEAPSQVDGEFIGREPLKIEVVPDALTLLIPPDYR